jgi:hypothetical protein
MKPCLNAGFAAVVSSLSRRKSSHSLRGVVAICNAAFSVLDNDLLLLRQELVRRLGSNMSESDCITSTLMLPISPSLTPSLLHTCLSCPL